MLVPSLRHDVLVLHNIFMKRLFDVCISSILLVITLPVMVLTAIFIYLESPGPIFCCQPRIGDHGHQFALLKFRTTCLIAEPKGNPTETNPRSTRVGRIIRQLRIDELPQLINVLRGEMSFVGLRPK